MNATTAELMELERAIEKAVSDPGKLAGYRGGRTLSRWITDAILIEIDRILLLAPVDTLPQGRDAQQGSGRSQGSAVTAKPAGAQNLGKSAS